MPLWNFSKNSSDLVAGPFPKRVNSEPGHHHHHYHHQYSDHYHHHHHNLGKRVNSKPGQPTKRWVVKRSRGVGGEAVGDCEHLIFRN